MISQSIRTATTSDAKAIACLLRQAFEEFAPLYTPESFVATVQPEDGVLKRLREGPVWLAESASGVIGTVSAVCLEDALVVRGMAVAPEARGRGIGRALLTTAEDFARNRGLNGLSLYTTQFLADAISLYRAFGFTFTGETVSPNGTELLKMVKTLERTPSE